MDEDMKKMADMLNTYTKPALVQMCKDAGFTPGSRWTKQKLIDELIVSKYQKSIPLVQKAPQIVQQIQSPQQFVPQFVPQSPQQFVPQVAQQLAQGLSCDMKLSQCNNTNKYNIEQIRQLAASCGLPTSGTRKELCERIVKHQSQQNPQQMVPQIAPQVVQRQMSPQIVAQISPKIVPQVVQRQMSPQIVPQIAPQMVPQIVPQIIQQKYQHAPGLSCNMTLPQCNNTNKFKIDQIRKLAEDCGVPSTGTRKELCNNLIGKNQVQPNPPQVVQQIHPGSPKIVQVQQIQPQYVSQVQPQQIQPQQVQQIQPQFVQQKYQHAPGLSCNMTLPQCNNTNKFKIDQIRKLAEDCGIPNTGTRKELCERLVNSPKQVQQQIPQQIQPQFVPQGSPVGQIIQPKRSPVTIPSRNRPRSPSPSPLNLNEEAECYNGHTLSDLREMSPRVLKKSLTKNQISVDVQDENLPEYLCAVGTNNRCSDNSGCTYNQVCDTRNNPGLCIEQDLAQKTGFVSVNIGNRTIIGSQSAIDALTRRLTNSQTTQPIQPVQLSREEIISNEIYKFLSDKGQVGNLQDISQAMFSLIIPVIDGTGELPSTKGLAKRGIPFKSDDIEELTENIISLLARPQSPIRQTLIRPPSPKPVSPIRQIPTRPPSPKPVSPVLTPSSRPVSPITKHLLPILTLQEHNTRQESPKKSVQFAEIMESQEDPYAEIMEQSIDDGVDDFLKHNKSEIAKYKEKLVSFITPLLKLMADGNIIEVPPSSEIEESYGLPFRRKKISRMIESIYDDYISRKDMGEETEEESEDESEEETQPVKPRNFQSIPLPISRQESPKKSFVVQPPPPRPVSPIKSRLPPQPVPIPRPVSPIKSVIPPPVPIPRPVPRPQEIPPQIQPQFVPIPIPQEIPPQIPKSRGPPSGHRDGEEIVDIADLLGQLQRTDETGLGDLTSVQKDVLKCLGLLSK